MFNKINMGIILQAFFCYPQHNVYVFLEIIASYSVICRVPHQKLIVVFSILCSPFNIQTH